jgi:hypothetical protein
MALNFNTQPYYDDFNDNKNFHKILFKPGVSVQARELTQLQSILQDQIGKFGKFVLSDGSKVTGGRYFIDTNVKYLKLAVTSNLSTDIQEFKSKYIVGVSSSCFGLITSIDIVNNYITVKLLNNTTKNFISGEELSIFSSKINALMYSSSPSTSEIQSEYTCNLDVDTSFSISGVYGIVNSYEFTINSVAIELGDVLTFPDSNNPYDNYVVTELVKNSVFRVNKPLDETYSNVQTIVKKTASRNIMEIGFDEGVYFTNNHFVKALPLTVIPNTKTQYPTCVVGYEVTEAIVDFIDDSSLLDPAQNSYNYSAPGADRYKIYLNLVSKPLVDGEIKNLTSTKFIELIRIKNGIIIKDNTQPTLGELEKVLAKQMYDHAGNFIVKDFSLSFHNSAFTDNESKLKAELSSGKAYVFGHEFEQSYPKFFDIDKGRDTNNIDNYYTSIYYGNHISIGKPTGILLNPQSSARVELHSTTKNSANKSTFIAYAYVRNIKYISDTEYYLYLYNISATETQLSTVQSVVIPTSSDYSSFTFAADTIQENGKLSIVDSSFNSLLFELPYKNVASLSDVTLSIDKFSTATVTSNNYILHSGSGKHFSSGIGTLSSDVKKSNFVIVTTASSGVYSIGEYVDLDNVSIVVTQSGAEYIASITFNSGYTGSISIKYAVDVTSTTQKIKLANKNQVVGVFAKTTPTSLGFADIANFTGVYYSPHKDASYIGEWNSSITYNQHNVVFSGGRLYCSNIDSNINVRPSITTSNWSVLETVTSNYNFNNGQTQSIYDHGTITAKTNLDEKLVFVLFDYYTHSTGEYLTFNSYSGIPYTNIPSVQLNSINYDLKNYIDFRPRRTNNSTSLIFDNYEIPSTIFSDMHYNFSYYLGRIDKLVLTDNKSFQWIKGVPAYTNQVPPTDLVNAMTIATIEISPFTASLKDISVKYKKHRRYTMDDIGKLEQRISNVEYYTSLNMVEKDVMSRNIYDNVAGNRMKNGFVVDPFVGYGVMSIADNYKNCSLDLTEQALRPSFRTEYYDSNVDMKTLPSTLLNKSDIISFNYTETQLTSQILATSTINCNPFDVISYSGKLFLNPQSDVWVDTQTKPIINIINPDTEALATSTITPGLVYDEWNKFYSSTPNLYSIDNTNTTVVTQNDRAMYSISSALVTQSDVTKILSDSIIPFARSKSIQFKATNLAPLTKMFVYINGKLVNGYITPNKNIKGSLSSICITDPGEGYYSGNTTVSFIGANTSTATVELNFLGSTISGIEFTKNGTGYTQVANTLATTLNGSGSNGAILVSTIQPLGGDLYSDEYGECSGVLEIPNDQLLKFPSGDLHIIVCDNPNYDPSQAISKAEAIFYSSGRSTVSQQTVTSIREPYIKFVGWAPIIPTQQGKIVVDASEDYIVNNYEMGYTVFKTGTIQLPVFLNKKPNSSVTVVASNASGDQSSNTTYSISPATLTFTDTNYNTKQYFTLTYDLGDRPTNYLNKLFSYLEYYGTSDDTGFNYAGTKPAKLWNTSSTTPGISYTQLNPINKKRAITTPASISASTIPTAQETGSTQFTVSISGQKFDEYLPITFTVSSSNTSICTVDGIYKCSTNKNSLIKSNQVVIDSLDDLQYFTVAVNYSSVGNANAAFTITSTSTDTYWNNIQTTANFTHIGTSIPPALPEILIKPSSESTLYTTEDGKTAIIDVVLSSQPNTNVAIYAISTNKTEGVVTRVANNALTFVSGNTINFTTSNWKEPKSIEITGQPDSVVDGTVLYNVNLRSSSANGYWNNLQANAAIENRDTTVIPPVIPGFIYYSYLNGNRQTSESGNTVTLQVSLSKAPTTNVFMSAKSSNEIEGKCFHIMDFTPLNWNTPQNVVVTGQPDSVVDGTANYNVDFLCYVSNDKNFYLVSNTAPIANIDTTVPYKSPGTLTITRSGSQTSESGHSVTFTTKLDSAPSDSVVVSYSSSNLSEGKITAGSMLTFTTSNWNVPQTTIVTGQDDSSYKDGNDSYTISVNTSSIDSVYDKLKYSYDLINLAKAAPPAGSIITSTSGTQTSESGTNVTIKVSLSRAPLTNITVTATSDNTAEGVITSGSSLTFTPSNWNITQVVQVTGQSDSVVDGTVAYNINLVAGFSALDPNGFTSAKVGLTNINTNISTYTQKTFTTNVEYEVWTKRKISPDTWIPGVAIDKTSTKIISSGAVRVEPVFRWDNSGISNQSKEGSFNVTLSCFIDGIVGGDSKPDGWAGVNVKLDSLDGTLIGQYSIPLDEKTQWKEYTQSGLAVSAGAPPFKMVSQDNYSVVFQTLILEQDTYNNRPLYEPGNPSWSDGQRGIAKTNWLLKHTAPDFRYYGVVLREWITVTTKTDVINSTTGAIISTSTSTDRGWGDVWECSYEAAALLGQTIDKNNGAIGVIGSLNPAGKQALYDFVFSFPSIKNDPINAKGFQDWFDWLKVNFSTNIALSGNTYREDFVGYTFTKETLATYIKKQETYVNLLKSLKYNPTEQESGTPHILNNLFWREVALLSYITNIYNNWDK